MSRNSDQAPVPFTCPLIDEIIGAFDDFEFNDESWQSKDELIVIMEKIRSANDSLREWGNDECRDKGDLENEKGDLERDVDRLEDEVIDLNGKIEELESEIEELNEKL